MIQAGINGNKYDNMNPKTLSEPQNNENDGLDYEDAGHYSKNVDKKGGQKLNKVDRKVDRNKKSGQKK